MQVGPLISVIVPVYNVETYLQQCLNSIVGQTYSRLEIILVDDGSTDSSGLICDEYARRDSRIKVIHKQNAGQSSARNAGLDIALGDFISFVDSDDWIDLNLYQIFTRELGDAPRCDIYSFCMTEQYLDHSVAMLHGKDCTLVNDEVRSAFVDQELIWEYVCDKIWRRSIIGDIRFLYGKKNEDAIFTYQVLYSNPNILLRSAKQSFYNYRKGREGATTYQFHPQPILDQLQGGIEVTELVEIRFPKMRSLAYQYMLNHIKREALGKLNSSREKRALIPYFAKAIEWLKPRLSSVGYKADLKTRVFLSFPLVYCRLQRILNSVR